MSNVKHLIEFAEDFKEFDLSLNGTRSRSEISNYNSFFKDYVKLEQSLDKILKEESPYYNIFAVLRIRHYEARVHTPFLCNLLNPLGAHGQSHLFIKSFITSVLNHSQEEAESLRNVHVYEELSIEYGRLDIMLEYNILGADKVVVIENKIYHHDGDEQLLRYYKYLTENRELDAADYKLLYLTVNKSQPSEISMPRDLFEVLSSTGNIVCCGYKHDIYPWLNACLSHVESKRIHTLIIQYLETINSL